MILWLLLRNQKFQSQHKNSFICRIGFYCMFGKLVIGEISGWGNCYWASCDCGNCVGKIALGKWPYTDHNSCCEITGIIVFKKCDVLNTGCPNKHGNSVTNSRSSLLRFSIVIPDFESHNIIMSARVYLINDCADVSARNTVNLWRRPSLHRN